MFVLVVCVQNVNLELKVYQQFLVVVVFCIEAKSYFRFPILSQTCFECEERLWLW